MKKLEQVTLVKEVKLSFWSTTYGILLKRVLFQFLSGITLVIYNQLSSNAIDFSAIRYALATQLVYIVMTFSRDLADQKIPNSTEAVKIEGK